VTDLASGLVQVLSLVHIDVGCEVCYLRATTTVRVVCFFVSSSLLYLFSFSGRSVARQELLATSLRLGSRVPLGAGYSCAPDLLLAKSGSERLNRTKPLGNLKSRLLSWVRNFQFQKWARKFPETKGSSRKLSELPEIVSPSYVALSALLELRGVNLV
jgi:hypothetical protein